MFLLEALFVQGGQVHMHRRLEVAVEYGLFWPFERLFSPYFTATHDWCKVTCPQCTKQGVFPSADLIPFIGEKIPFAGHNDCSGFGLVYNNLSEKKCGRLPSPLDVGLTKVFDCVRLKGRIRLILVGLYL